MGSTSIGRGPASGGNENHEADPMHTTLGEEVQQEPPAGNRNDLEAPPPEPGGADAANPVPPGKAGV